MSAADKVLRGLLKILTDTVKYILVKGDALAASPFSFFYDLLISAVPCLT